MHDNGTSVSMDCWVGAIYSTLLNKLAMSTTRWTRLGRWTVVRKAMPWAQ